MMFVELVQHDFNETVGGFVCHQDESAAQLHQVSCNMTHVEFVSRQGQEAVGQGVALVCYTQHCHGIGMDAYPFIRQEVGNAGGNETFKADG